MNKREFLKQLRAALAPLSRQEVEDRLTFYSEMIDDRMEEGLSEAEAVAAVGPVAVIAAQILSESGHSMVVVRKPSRALLITLAVLGFPLWCPLLIAAFAVVLSLYASVWAVIISLWAVFASLAICAPVCVAGGIILICTGHFLTGIAAIGIALVCAGLSIFLFFGCCGAVKGTVYLTKALFRRIFRQEVHHG